jgi:hypothetical protein
VLAADIDLVDIDGVHWRHWYELLVPSRLRGRASWALLFTDGPPPARVAAGLIHDAREPGQVRAVTLPAGGLHVGGGASATPAQTARDLGVDAVVVIDLHVTSALYDDIARALAPGDLVAQGLTFLRVCKRYGGRGIWAHPAMLEVVPPVLYDSLQRTFDLLVADRSSMVVYVFEDDASDVHASLIAVKRGGDVDLVTTHLGLEDALAGPDLARGWRQRYRELLKLVAERHAPASLAVFLERRTFERILTGPSDQLAREVGARSVIIDPVPGWMLGLLGGATMAAFATRGAKALARMLPSPARQMAAGLAQTAQSVMRESGAHPFDLLGFDPIALWNDLRGLYRR